MTRRLAVWSVATLLTVAFLAAGLLWMRRPRALTITAGQHPEELVYVSSTDDVIRADQTGSAPRPQHEAAADARGLDIN